MKNTILNSLSIALFLGLATMLTAQNSDLYMYGQVTSVDNEIYTGQIRWDREEAYWFDMFNATKLENDNLKYLSKDEMKDLTGSSCGNKKKTSWSGWNAWNNNSSYSSSRSMIHTFACQFGEIQSIDIKGRNDVRVALKNGERLAFEGGSNDIGAKIQVVDTELGLVKLDWDRVAKVEFMNSPRDMASHFGEPLYGVVETDYGTYTGFVQWDHDERMALDILNGSSDDGEMEVAFHKIKSIKKVKNSADVTFHSGRTINLEGTNDVNCSNKGIVVYHPDFGRADIPWSAFESVVFTEVPTNQSKSYDNYKGHTEIRGSVVTNTGKTLNGILVYDLDESRRLEVLDGKKDNVEFFIPFSNIQSITPLNKKESEVVLVDNTKIVFEDTVDVDERNSGLLICSDSKKCEYVRWEDVEKVNLKQL